MFFSPTPTHPSALHTRARPYLLSRHRPHAQHTRTPLHPAALASVPYGIVLVRVRVLSRYRRNRLPLLCSESGSPRSPQIPPPSESKHAPRPRLAVPAVPLASRHTSPLVLATTLAPPPPKPPLTEASAVSSVSAPYLSSFRSASVAGPLDGPFDKAKQATVPTTLTAGKNGFCPPPTFF